MLTPQSPSNDDMALPYRTMAHNNAWANYRLLTACAQLAQDEFTARRTGFFPSLRATLNHVLIVDRFYVDAMEGGTLGPSAWSDPEPCATVALLHEAQADVDRRLLAVVRNLDSAGLCRIVSVHRGQAHAMMSGTLVRPPQLDEFFPVGEADLRAHEFAALGWTEDAIWADKN